MAHLEAHFLRIHTTLDEILTEEIKNFGPATTQWVLSLLNACARTHRLPRLWRQARVVALLKPGKDPSISKSFRPISILILCHLYKLYERLILNHLSPIIEHALIPEQAGFRLGKSCTAQVLNLNLTQHIEDGFGTGKITGIVLVDVSAAYDTVNDRRRSTTWQETTAWCVWFALYWRTVVSSWNSDGKEVDGNHREMAYRRGVSWHHFSSTYTQTTSLFTGYALFCVCRRLCCHYTEHGLCTDRGNTDLSYRRSVGVLHLKSAPCESTKDASQPLPPAESWLWQTAQHQLERCEPNPLQPPGVSWRHTGPNVVV